MKKKFKLPEKTLISIHDLMIKTRTLEERMIKMYKMNEGYFWLGGPGEEAFNIPLGMFVKKGEGTQFDFLHLHYRSSGILLAMGLEPIDFIRQMKNVATDPFSGGRNFCNHVSKRSLNVPPITSTIETQYLTAIGTGLAQKREGGTGITIVNGGDAGTAEGDFESSLIWSSIPKQELPMLLIVTNNSFGISTPAATMHGEAKISDRARVYQMPAVTINGNDVEESYYALKEAIDYIRKERKPYFIEAKVSRLYGHSSASGANWATGEEDPIVIFEKQLEEAGVLTRKKMDDIREKYVAEFLDASRKIREEPMPDPETIYDHTYYGQKGKYF